MGGAPAALVGSAVPLVDGDAAAVDDVFEVALAEVKGDAPVLDVVVDFDVGGFETATEGAAEVGLEGEALIVVEDSTLELESESLPRL
jgi:hypothetical protein